MKIRFFNRLGLALLLGSTLAITACQRDEDEAPAAVEVESAEVNAMTEIEFTSVDAFVEESAMAEPQLNAQAIATENLPACASRTFNRDTRTLTIDFGSTNCAGRDGVNRRGKIVAVFSGNRGETGAKVTITLQNYFVNDNQLTGTKVKTYLGNRKIGVVVSGASITTPKGTASWAADRVLEMVAGHETPRIADDVWQITGTASGVNRNGVAYTATIEQPLKKVLSIGCARNFVSGVLTITNERGGILSVNYDPVGGEPCDKIAEVTINGKNKTIQLR